jgi:hypothetical protein
MVSVTDTHGHDVVWSPPLPLPFLSTPEGHSWHQQHDGQLHWPAGTPYVTTPSPTSAVVLRASVTRPSSPEPRFHRRQALRPRRDVAKPGASSPVPPCPCSRVATLDIIARPRPPSAAIKGATPAPKPSHNQLPLSLLSLLDHLSRSIHHRSPSIARRRPMSRHRSSRRIRPPPPLPRPPFTSPSSTTSPRVNAAARRTLVSSPTPSLRRQ